MNIRGLFGWLFYSHSPLAVCSCGLVLVHLLARAMYGREATRRLSTAGERLLPFMSWAMVAAIFGLIILNAVFPAFVWLGESQMASASFLLLKGFPLYHSADNPERYSLLYGPMNYLPTAGVFWIFGSSIFTAKLVNSILLLTTGGTAALIVARRTSLPVPALAAFFSILLPPVFSSPLILLSSIAAYYLYYCSQWRFRTVVIGVCVGLACGTKIHSGLYFLPIFVDMLLRRNLIGLLAAGLSGVATIGAPFLVPTVDARNYYFWLRSAAEHGLLWRIFIYQAEWLFYELSVVAAALFLVVRHSGEDALSAMCPPLVRAAAAGAILLVMIVASKAGSGFHHLLPLAPCYVVVLLPWVRKCMARVERAGCIPRLRILAVTYLLLVFAFNAVSVAHIYSQILRVPALAIRRDLIRIAGEHPDARIVLGDAESTPGEWQDKPGVRGRFSEPLLLFKGHPYLYDPIALMDMAKTGLTVPGATIERLRDGSIDIWLFPKGREPFNLVNWYDYKTPVFPSEFRDAFFANYERDGTSEFYDLWIFRRR